MATKQIECEVKKVTTRKTASLDIEHQVTLSTSDPKLIELSYIPSDTTILMSWSIQNGKR